jgi:solute carrier family 35 protein F5
MWPVFPILHFLGLEKFELPFSPYLWVMVLLNAFIGTFLSDYLWLLAMLMTSPLVVTLGISLTVSFKK